MAFLVGVYGPIARSLKHTIKQLIPASLLNLNSTKISDSTDFFCVGVVDEKDDNVIVIPSKGMVVGKLFNNATYEPITFFEEHTSVTLQDIASSCWGRYSGVLFDAKSNSLSLIRDPLGLTTLYYYRVSESLVFSTDITLLYDLLKPRPALDWNYFIEFLLDENHVLQKTPFEGIEELFPGYEYTVTGSAIYKKFIWNIPTQQEHLVLTPDDTIEEELLHKLISCVKAWTKASKGITVELSGGVDSSSLLILLTSILGKDIPIIAVHYHDTNTPSSQELAYAQNIADACGSPLKIIDLAPLPLIDELSYYGRFTKPNSFLLIPGLSKQLAYYADTTSCPDILSGQGGDHVFLAPPEEISLADYWLDHGFKGISEPLNQLSAQYRTSWWSLVKKSLKALAGYFSGLLPQQESDNKDIFEPTTLALLKPYRPYLDKELQRYYPAKASQIRALSHAVAYADRDERFNNKVVIHPLLSQPLVEYALRIPTYRTIKKDYNRYFFRKAVSRLKQSPVIWRKSKGEVSASYLKLMNNQYDTIRQLLHEGSLIKAAILKSSWIDDNLTQVRHGTASNLLPFLRVIACQLWLNKWKL